MSQFFLEVFEHVNKSRAEEYESYDALIAHMESPAVQAHIQEKFEKEILRAPLEVVMYCDWTDKQKEPFIEIPETKFTYAPLVNGYFR